MGIEENNGGYEVECNWPGCTEIHGREEPFEYEDWAWESAVADGWQVTDDGFKAYCRDHAIHPG
jgi:hypothetical protein